MEIATKGKEVVEESRKKGIVESCGKQPTF
jgi:hypothetical protein